MLFNFDGVISAYESLFFCVLYVYALKFPEISFHLVGAFQIRMEWFFWIIFLINLTKDNAVDLMIGVFAGGLFLWLKESLPVKVGVVLLETPMFLFA